MATTKKEIKLKKNESFVKDEHGDEIKCPECGGILVSSSGFGVKITCCVDCEFNTTSYC